MNLRDIQTKASIIAQHVNAMFLGYPVYPSVNYQPLIKNSYNRSVWVYACVRAISESASTIPLLLYQRRGNKIVEVEKHPLLDLLRKPNPEENDVQYRQNVISYLLLTGNSYEEVVRGVRYPTEMYAWRPDRTKVVPGKEGIKEFCYTVSGMETFKAAEEVVHHKMFNALDDFYGLSPVEVARFSVGMDNATQDWNTSVVQNSGAPSGILMAKEDLAPREERRITAKLRSLFGGGFRNAGKAQVLSGDLQWLQLGLAPKDMDFINSRKMSREEICAIFRTPPQIVGIQESSTYNNYKEARQAFYIEAVLPMLDRFIAGYNAKLVPLFGDDSLFISYDRDKIEALQESADAKFERMRNADNLLQINERREALGYSPIKGGNVMFVSAGPLTIALGEDAPLYEEKLNATAAPLPPPTEKPPDTISETDEEVVEQLKAVHTLLQTKRSDDT